jgi:hypothetical protein
MHMMTKRLRQGRLMMIFVQPEVHMVMRALIAQHGGGSETTRRLQWGD